MGDREETWLVTVHDGGELCGPKLDEGESGQATPEGGRSAC